MSEVELWCATPPRVHARRYVYEALAKRRRDRELAAFKARQSFTFPTNRWLTFSPDWSAS